MADFRLSDMSVMWSGVDSTTPLCHSIALGRDPLGNIRIWLFASDTPQDETHMGSVLIPNGRGARLIAYGPTGAYVRSGTDQAELLAHLAYLVDRPATTA